MLLLSGFLEISSILIIALFVGFISLSLRDYFLHKKLSSLFFGFLITASCLWVFSLYLFTTTSSQEILDMAAKLIWFAAPQLISSLYLFTYFYRIENISTFKSNTFVTVGTSLVGWILSLSSVFTNLVVKSTDIEIRKMNYTYIYYVTVIFIALYAFQTIRTISNHKNLTTGNNKQAVKVIYYGVLLTLSFALFSNILIPTVVGSSKYSFLGIFATIPINIAIAYSIIKYRLFDVRIFLGRLTYYGVLSLIVLITYRIVLITNTLIWGDPLDLRGLISGAVFAFIFVIFYDGFKKFIQSNITSRLINPGFEPNEIIVSFNKQISTLLDYEEIAGLLDDTVEKTIRPNLISVFVKLEEKNQIILKTQSEENKVSLDYDNIYKLWNNSTYMPIFLDQIELEVPRQFSASFHELSMVVEEMKAKKIRLILPIGIKENSNGIMVLGAKEGDSSYNSVQIKYLESLCEITSLALIRAKLYEEVQEFNQTLQQKVKDATLEIQSQNSKLSEALRVERDMLDVLGHELRTPLGTIRNSMGVLELKYKANQFQNADLESFLKIGTENIRREIQLLETILASAKIDNDKLDMNFEKVDSNDVVGDSFEAYKYDAEKKGLKLVKTIPAEIIYGYADRIRIQQVMDNLVSNAVKYTQTGQIELKLEDEGKYVKFSVIDSGEGIPEADISKLGTKFFRANMYLKSEGKLGDRKIVRPGGTGIGLYVVFQIVKYMYGEVKVTSTLGHGSTFSFTVLKYTQELEDRNSFIVTGKDSVRIYNQEDKTN